MSPFVFVAFSTIFGICGQLLLKRGMGRMDTSGGGRVLLRIATSPWVIGGLAVYGTGVIFWLLALSYLELSYVYPFASLSYIGIIIGSYFLFKERLNALRLVGIAVIIIGVFITSLS
ncbi:MAG: multidrug resistance protein [Chloroflexi bacterium]|jgi:multidrug transporter EmrE-like cation transporter|nr:multidrug resistance protein [Chloroflexota bacterium]MDL1885614.1 multidrug resistance protein [Anaerolineae bacterium CFX8]